MAPQRKPELLAPAGGWPQLRAAIAFGADAVYLASDRFGMRARATNFPPEELPAAVAEAHAAGVKVHVTCNILMHDDDIAQLPDYFRMLDAAGVDAVVVSDLGAAAVAREVAPRLELHVSTQASVANAAAARAWASLGAKRIVLAREMSLADIAALRAQLDPSIELETFVHGAMCMAVSGRCLISSYLTGRSGNLGHCTQPCRWNYRLAESGAEETFYGLEEEKRPGMFFPIEEDPRGSYIMNACDLNMLAHVADLAAAGVDSIKIEGRNKKALYVATVVNAYRHVLDGDDPAIWAPELENVSHRPYSTGFFFGMAPQAADYEGYQQECLHVADVLACDPAGEWMGEGESERADAGESADETATASAAYRVTLQCHNRFNEGDELELLSPGEPVRSFVIKDLTWYQLTDKGPTGLLRRRVANRATVTDRYIVTTDRYIAPGSLIRRREFRRTSRVVPCAEPEALQ